MLGKDEHCGSFILKDSVYAGTQTFLLAWTSFSIMPCFKLYTGFVCKSHLFFILQPPVIFIFCHNTLSLLLGFLTAVPLVSFFLMSRLCCNNSSLY